MQPRFDYIDSFASMALTARKIAVTVSSHHRQGISVPSRQNHGLFLYDSLVWIYFVVASQSKKVANRRPFLLWQEKREREATYKPPVTERFQLFIVRLAFRAKRGGVQSPSAPAKNLLGRSSGRFLLFHFSLFTFHFSLNPSEKAFGR